MISNERCFLCERIGLTSEPKFIFGLAKHTQVCVASSRLELREARETDSEKRRLVSPLPPLTDRG